MIAVLGGCNLWVVYVSLIGTAVSLVITTWAIFHVTNWRFSAVLRFALIVAGTFIAMYHVSYWWLLLHDDQVVHWSNSMRPIGAISWFIGPWTAFPIALSVQTHKLRNRIRTEADEVLEEFREAPHCDSGG